MSKSERIFLDGGKLTGDNGSRVNPEFSFTSEQDLDNHLWLDPEAATKDLRFLLDEHRGKMTPILSRLALKGITLPLFKREFYGGTAPSEVEEEIHAIPEQNSQLLDAYLDRIGDADINQKILKQAIDDATAIQLVSRSDDIVLLPAGPEKDHDSSPTRFTVLRRERLGRALLFVASVPPVAHLHTPKLNEPRIQIRPADLLTKGANRYDLAEALIAEQRDGVISTEDYDLIEKAEAHILHKINHHLDTIRPKS
jgi:hypothetical protein